MKIYGENEEKKDQNDIFGVLIVTELKELSKWKKKIDQNKNPKPPKHADSGWRATKQEKIIFTSINQRLIIHNPLAIFPRFLDPTILLNGGAEILNEISLSFPPIFHSTPNLATSLASVLDPWPGIGKK